MFFPANLINLSLIDMMQAIAIITGIAGHLLLARRNVNGYWVWIVGNFATIYLSYEKQLFGMAFLFVLYTMISCWAIWNWQHPNTQAQQPE